MATESPVKEGAVVAGKYRVERTLGVGSMGVVVAAFHAELERRVAIKFLQKGADERFDAGRRFRREARVAARIQDEHVARIFDFGALDDGTPYIVMEYLEGNNLAEEVLKRGALPVGEAVDYVLQAIQALAEAHELGIVHRDLKPSNLYLAKRPDGSRMIKLLDFGVAKSPLGRGTEEMLITRAELLIGSPRYMSPEQLTSATAVDARSDIWSLGVILYHLLTGRAPYNGTSIAAICAALLNETPPRVADVRTDVPVSLSAVITRCLAREPSERFGSVAELAGALAEFATPVGKLCADRAVDMLSAGGPPLSLTVVTTGTGPRDAKQIQSAEASRTSWSASQVATAFRGGRSTPLLVAATLLLALAGSWFAFAPVSEATTKPSLATPSPTPTAAGTVATATSSRAPVNAPKAAPANVPKASSVAAPPAPSPIAARAPLPRRSRSTGTANVRPSNAITDFGGRR